MSQSMSSSTEVNHIQHLKLKNAYFCAQNLWFFVFYQEKSAQRQFGLVSRFILAILKTEISPERWYWFVRKKECFVLGVSFPLALKYKVHAYKMLLRPANAEISCWGQNCWQSRLEFVIKAWVSCPALLSRIIYVYIMLVENQLFLKSLKNIYMLVGIFN